MFLMVLVLVSPDPPTSSPHGDGFVAQVDPTLAHVVQATPQYGAVLRVAQRGGDSAAVLVEGVIELRVTLDLRLEVLVTRKRTHAQSKSQQTHEKSDKKQVCYFLINKHINRHTHAHTLHFLANGSHLFVNLCWLLQCTIMGSGSEGAIDLLKAATRQN